MKAILLASLACSFVLACATEFDRKVDRALADPAHQATIALSSFTVDGVKLYAFEYGPNDARHAEIYAANSQLLAATTGTAPLTWATLTP